MLPVYHEDRLVGQVEEERAGLAFSYAPGWLARADAFAISLTMPLREVPYPREVATPWFANLLPEDRQLEQIGRLLGRAQGDVYGLLEAIGRDTAGAGDRAPARAAAAGRRGPGHDVARRRANQAAGGDVR